MRIAVLLLLLSSGPSTAQPADGPSAGPTLITFTPEDAAALEGVEGLVKNRLSSLAQCPAFVANLQHEGLRGAPYLLRDPDALDDRMELQLRRGGDDGSQLEARVLSGAASDFDCVEDTIKTWTFTKQEWALLERALPAQLVYRFTPSPKEREVQRREAEAGLDRLCAAYKKRPAPAKVTQPYLALREKLTPRLRLRLDRIAQAVDTLPKGSSDRLMLFGAVMNELAAQWGLGSRCAPMTDALTQAPAPALNALTQRLTEDAAALRSARFELPVTFVEATTRAGVSKPALERVVRSNLASLSECVAFSQLRDDTLVKFEPSGDDLVSVTVDAELIRGLDEPPTLGLRVNVSRPGWSDAFCVKAVVSSWEFPLAQLEAMASMPSSRVPAMQFSARFRPGAEARKTLQRANTKALEPLCEAYRAVAPSSKAPEALALSRLATVPPWLRLQLRGVAGAVSAAREHGGADDVAWLWASSWREIELMAGVERPCAAFDRWPIRRPE